MDLETNIKVMCVDKILTVEDRLNIFTTWIVDAETLPDIRYLSIV